MRAAHRMGTITARRESIERIIHDYILKHPEVVIEALQSAEDRDRAVDSEQRARAAVDQLLMSIASLTLLSDVSERSSLLGPRPWWAPNIGLARDASIDSSAVRASAAPGTSTSRSSV